MAVSVMWAGLGLAGYVILVKELKSNEIELTEWITLTFRSVLGVIDDSEIVYSSLSSRLYWFVYFLFVVVIVFNGLISIMTYSLLEGV